MQSSSKAPYDRQQDLSLPTEAREEDLQLQKAQECPSPPPCPSPDNRAQDSGGFARVLTLPSSPRQGEKTKSSPGLSFFAETNVHRDTRGAFAST